ncbi:hypothetical protein [Ferruginibacter sp. SUN106]|uniref:hypothetical protein n=1 Tax=Ferruginibacter sp. SUN106 TaxID=2978348 RepID=UPI003D35FE01
MKNIAINKTIILSMLATAGIFAYNNWRQRIESSVKQDTGIIKSIVPQKAAVKNTSATSDENSWNDITAYKYISSTGMPVVNN